MSEQLAVRVIGTPQTTTQAVLRLPALFEVDHQHSPCPSRKTPGRVRYYLTARLRPGWIDQAPLAQIEDRKAARDPRGHAPDCPAALRGRPPYGATFLAVAWPRSGSEVRFRVVSRPRPTTPRRGAATRSRTCGLRGRRSRWCAPARSFCHRAGGGGGPAVSGADRLTPAEVRLAEQYVRVLDFVSRCAQAIDRGDWFDLYDKASQLQDAARGLQAVADETWQQISAGKSPPRKQAIRAAVTWYGRHYRAGRLLHPTEPGRPGGEPQW